MALGAGSTKASATGSEQAPQTTGPGAKTPAMRQQEHADKKRQFDARRVLTPGPGSYTPAKSSGGALASGTNRKTSTGGSASFASKSKRISSDKADNMGDPGSYDPYMLKELAITSKKSASKALRAGQGAFGAKQQRKMPIDVMGESTPGPGAYNGDVMMKNGKKAALSAFDTSERMPSSAFKSKSSKDIKQHNEHVPGAGAYTPQYEAVQPSLAQNPAHSMKGKGNRFKGANSFQHAQKAEPVRLNAADRPCPNRNSHSKVLNDAGSLSLSQGPGAYEIEYLRSGTKSALASRSSVSSSKEIAFSSDALRELPWEN